MYIDLLASIDISEFKETLHKSRNGAPFQSLHFAGQTGHNSATDYHYEPSTRCTYASIGRRIVGKPYNLTYMNWHETEKYTAD